MSLRRNFRHSRRFFVISLATCLSLKALPTQAQQAEQVPTEELRKQVVSAGLQFLAEKGQDDKGMFSARVGPGVTALAVTAALRNGKPLDDPLVRKGLTALETFVKPDGGIYGGGRLKNYETCVAMLCFAEANKNGQYNDILKQAKEFVTGIQYGEGKRSPDDPWYGGVGYGGAERPDLSNTGYFIEALRATETSPDDPAIQRALQFISRCQNLDSPANDTRFAALVDDGGFYYEIPVTEIDPSTSEERFTPDGGLRSYGSMSYTGLKSMIFAGLTSDDPRVKAAVQWIQNHYDVDSNPGMGAAGLYYYYHTFSAALKAAGIQQVKSKDGETHDWREDLVRELASRQNEDGSWANENQRWFENDKNLATTFALLSLAYCDPPQSTAAAKPE